MDKFGKQKIAVAVYIVASTIKAKQNLKNKRKLKKRSIWVREWLEKRSEYGAYECTLREFREVDNQNFLFKNYIRMNEQNFNELVTQTTPYIQKQDTTFRKAIPFELTHLSTMRQFVASFSSYLLHSDL